MERIREVGRRGELIASKHLAALGYEIRGRNISIGRDEIDILAFDPEDQVLVFAEVKTRSRDDRDFRPELNVDARKLSALRRAARAWVDVHAYEGGFRIDLVCVAHSRVSGHIRELAWE